MTTKSRRHGMRREKRRESALSWVQSGAKVTVSAYTRRYGVDRYTAYADLTAIGVALPASEQKWASRPPSTPRRKPVRAVEIFDDWIVLDGRRFFVVGHTPAEFPYGVFEDEMSWPDL